MDHASEARKETNFLKNKFLKDFTFIISVDVCVDYMRVSACGGQKKMLDPPGAVVSPGVVGLLIWVLHLNSNPMKEQQVIFMAEPSF